jgi:hypothetical protein
VLSWVCRKYAPCCLLNDPVRTEVRAHYPLPSLRVLTPSNNSPPYPPVPCPTTQTHPTIARDCTITFGILCSFILSACDRIRPLYFLLFSFLLLLPSFLYSEVNRQPFYEVWTVSIICSTQGPTWSGTTYSLLQAEFYILNSQNKICSNILLKIILLLTAITRYSLSLISKFL